MGQARGTVSKEVYNTSYIMPISARNNTQSGSQSGSASGQVQWTINWNESGITGEGWIIQELEDMYNRGYTVVDTYLDGLNDFNGWVVYNALMNELGMGAMGMEDCLSSTNIND